MKLIKQRSFQEVMLKFEFAKKKVETNLDILLSEYAFKEGYNPVEHVKSRIKSLNRIVQKLNKKGKEVTIDYRKICK